MAFFEWTDAFSVGVEEIDQQHKRLMDLVNRLHDAIECSNSLATMAAVLNEFDTVRDAIKELSAYASYHFTLEDQYMRSYAYPKREPHHQEHEAFIESIDVFQRCMDHPTKRVSLDVAAFCKDWWQKHILDMDQKVGAFLNERGVH